MICLMYISYLVDGSLNAVVLLNIQLGKLVVLIDRSLLEISEGGCLDYVSNLVSLDGLVLGDGFGGGRASVNKIIIEQER